jgi:hypothetical protein
LESEEQIKHLKNSDVELILVVLKINNVLIVRGHEISLNERYASRPEVKKRISEEFLELIAIYSSILKTNTDIQIHVQVTICLKNIIKLASDNIKARTDLVGFIV